MSRGPGSRRISCAVQPSTDKAIDTTPSNTPSRRIARRHLDAPAPGQAPEHRLADHQEVIAGGRQPAEVIAVSQIVARRRSERRVAQVTLAIDDEDLQHEIGGQALQRKLGLAVDRRGPFTGDGAYRLQGEIETVERGLDDLPDRARLGPGLQPRTLQYRSLRLAGVAQHVHPTEHERDQAGDDDRESNRIQWPLDGGGLYCRG
ncbi:hypothetical protein MASR2M50_36090 [Thauera sp.]